MSLDLHDRLHSGDPPNLLLQRLKRLVFRIKRGFIRLLFIRHKIYNLKIKDKTITFSTSDPVAHRWFYPRYAFNQLHEKPMTLRIVEDFRQAKCFLDVGANLGYYTCLAAHLMSKGTIYSFEMDVDNYRMLQDNTALNVTDNVVETYNYAVSKADGIVTYFRLPNIYHPELSIHQPRKSSDQQQMEIRAVSLDSFFSSLRLRPDLVKIDVEGAELDVLRGMTTLVPHISKMYMEIHPEILHQAGQSFSEIFELLSAEFNLYLIPDHRTQHSVDLIQIKPELIMTENMIIYAQRI